MYRLILGLWLMCTYGHAACPLAFTNTHTKQAIINYQQAAQTYTGLGSASWHAPSDIQTLIDTAKQNAMVDLTQAIWVSVQSTLTLQESVENSNVNTEFSANTNVYSKLALENVHTLGYWFDEDNCTLWARIAVSQTKANKALVTKQLEQVQQGYQSIPRLTDAIAQTHAMLANQAFEPADRDALSLRLTSIEQHLLRQQQAQQQYHDLQQKLVALSQLPKGRQIRLYRETSKQLRGLLPTFINSNYGIDLLPTLVNEIADLYHLSLDNCLIPAFLQRFPAYSHTQWYRAHIEANRDFCLQEDSANTGLVGAVVNLNCILTVDEHSSTWQKVCAEMSNWFVAHHAIPVYNTDKVLAADFTLRLTASGHFEENTSSKKRFNGNIDLAFDDSYGSIVEDNFSGITGWSHYPKPLIIDLLALNITQRIQAKLDAMAF